MVRQRKMESENLLLTIMKMKVIVTGSEGFIGKALCRALEARGMEVIGIDRKSELEAEDIEQVLMMGGISCVYHLAAQTSVFNLDHKAIIDDNIITFKKVADYCDLYGVKLVYASSSGADPENTTTIHGISKHFCEQYARIYCPTATGCRLHNVYGPEPRKGTLLWHLMQDSETILYNYGQNVRCFTYIDDVVDGLIMASGCNKQLINIANVQPVTVKYFAELVQSHRACCYTLSQKKRTFDNLEQSVNREVFLLPLSYTSVEEGIRRVFHGESSKNG